MLLGVGLVALPAGILAAKFSEELKSRRAQLSEHLSIALADGVIDDDEHAELIEKTEELRLSEEVLDQMMRARTESTGHVTCPSCGHTLSLQLSQKDDEKQDEQK
jgi:voltage-gated potassium channel